MRRILGTFLATVALLGADAGAVAQPMAGPAPRAPLGPRPSLPDTATVQARLEARLRRLAEEDGFEGVVRVEIGGRTVLATGVGYADPVRRIAYTADTQVEMGSIGKSFTAAAILKLKDAGRLGLDDPISRFIPGVPADKAAITLRQLLTHTSGLPMDVGRDLDALDRAGFEAAVFAAPLLSRPGDAFSYSNAGFSLLADIVERVSGRPYEDYLIDGILRPAGLTHTGYRRALDPKTAESAWDGRSLADASWGPAGPSWAIVGNGGLVTTAADMAAFRRAFMAGRIVSPASVAEATTGGVGEGEGRPERYGFGVGIADHPVLGRLVRHNGGNPWFTSDFHQLIDHDLFIFVSGNSRESASDAIAKLLRAVFAVPDPVTDPLAFPNGRLAADFAAAVMDPDPARRRAFVEQRFGPGFKQQAGLETLVKDFDALHATLADRRLFKVQLGSPGDAYAVFDPPQGGRRLAVQVVVGRDPTLVGGWSLRR